MFDEVHGSVHVFVFVSVSEDILRHMLMLGYLFLIDLVCAW
jgi:hypothetical protein